MKTLLFFALGVSFLLMLLQIIINKRKIRKLERENQKLELATTWQRNRIEQLKDE